MNYDGGLLILPKCPVPVLLTRARTKPNYNSNPRNHYHCLMINNQNNTRNAVLTRRTVYSFNIQ